VRLNVQLVWRGIVVLAILALFVLAMRLIR
jgi:hypothetical protein